MRSGGPFRTDVKDYGAPTYVFTLAHKGRDSEMQALVSIAEVSRDFKTMDEYARFLVQTGNWKLMRSRLTRLKRGSDLGWRFGDCHADEHGRVDRPRYAGHVHSGSQWERDIDGKHLILVSKRFVVWKEPAFVSRRMIKQSRFGHSITGENLEALLQEIE